jgi:hypothetical protein
MGEDYISEQAKLYVDGQEVALSADIVFPKCSSGLIVNKLFDHEKYSHHTSIIMKIGKKQIKKIKAFVFRTFYENYSCEKLPRKIKKKLCGTRRQRSIN